MMALPQYAFTFSIKCTEQMYFQGKDISEQLCHMLHTYTYLYITIHAGYGYTHMHTLHKLTEVQAILV